MSNKEQELKQYRLLKDLPTFRAGQLAYVSSLGNLMAGTPENPETTDTGLELMMYHRTTLEKFPEILTEWFEEIQEESTDSIHWEPKDGEKYWFLDENGDTNFACFDRDDPSDRKLLEFGSAYRTAQECEKARERKLAKVRLQRTSTFEPDFINENGGFTVYYDPYRERLYYARNAYFNSGEPVRYETREDALKSIKENERDWKIYFGIEEKK